MKRTIVILLAAVFMGAGCTTGTTESPAVSNLGLYKPPISDTPQSAPASGKSNFEKQAECARLGKQQHALNLQEYPGRGWITPSITYNEELDTCLYMGG